MNYTIDEQGIHFSVEPIPDAVAPETVKRILEQQRAALDSICECEQQGAQPCGACAR